MPLPLRRELKFLVGTQLPDVRAWMRQHLPADPHGTGVFGDEYVTTTVYFDTVDRDVFYRRRRLGRSKLRVRRYGASDVVFLERKLRTDDVLAKRRTEIPIFELARLDVPLQPEWAGAWFHKRLAKRRLAPACQMSYVRVAREVDARAGTIRVTIDTHLRGLLVSAVGRLRQAGTVIAPDKAIVEVKFSGEMPALVQELLHTFDLRPQAISKYRFGLAALEDRSLDTRDVPPAHPETSYEQTHGRLD